MSTEEPSALPAAISSPTSIARVPPQPLEPADVSTCLLRPARLADLVLGQPARIGASIAQQRALGGLSVALIFASALAAIPFGCVLGWESWWRVVVLYLGTTAICAPSLYVFTSYLGLRRSLQQVAVLALTIPATAALFTIGFAPILAFLRATMDEQSDLIGWRLMSVFMLVFAALAGVVQLWRCLLASRRAQDNPVLYVVLIGWHLVLAHVLWRMGGVLGLGA